MDENEALPFLPLLNPKLKERELSARYRDLDN